MVDKKSIPGNAQEHEDLNKADAGNRAGDPKKDSKQHKILPSARQGNVTTRESDKILPSGSNVQKGSGEKELPSAGESTTQEQLATPVTAAASAIIGDSLKDRIRFATLDGGLKKLPPGFDDDSGDWQCIKSENVFERLYLDYVQYKKITPEMVEKHYQLLHEFWDEKCALLHQGANRLRFQQKYGQEIEGYPKRLRLAYKQLATPGGIENSFMHLDNERRQHGRESLQPLLDEAVIDNKLEPAEENMIKNMGRSETELTEEEINELIEEWLAKTNSIRTQGGAGVQESERLFFHQIKKTLRDKLLTREDEAGLAEDAPVYNIAPERMNELILQALRETGNAERESTLKQDKERFKDFYYGLLRDHSLEDGDKLPEAALAILRERDNSETDFFPLSNDARKALVQETLKKYKIDLADEKERFYQDVLEKLAVYDKDGYARNTLLHDDAYKLLLEEMRRELIDAAVQEIVEKQSELFTQAAKLFYQKENWKPRAQAIAIFIEDPNHPFEDNWVRCDWLRREDRDKLLGDVTKWAEAEYAREVRELRALVQSEFKTFPYGLPLQRQLEIEADDQFHLSQQERREIIIELEKERRKQAEEKFTERVRDNLVFETLIPKREATLLKDGEATYLLNDAKIKNSTEVKTAQEIIKSLIKAFELVVQEQVAGLVAKYKMDPDIVEAYKLEHNAYISKTDLEVFIDAYHPKNKEERKTVIEAFRKSAREVGLHIIETNRITEFKELLYRVMETASGFYKRRLKKWFTDKFQKDLLKVSAAFGVDRKSAENVLSILKDDYQEWTLPKWGRFIIVFISISLFFTLLRVFTSLTGYSDWIMAAGPVRMYATGKLLEAISFSAASYYAQANLPIFLTIAIIVALIVMIYAYKAFDGEGAGWAALFSAVLAGAFVYFIAIPWLIFAFGNLGILVANLGILIWSVLQNAWAYAIKFTTYLDYLLCGLPFDPVIAWAVWGSAIALLLGFLFATKGLKRSYLKVHTGIASVLLIGCLVVFFVSKKEIKSFENRQAELAKTGTSATVLNADIGCINQFPVSGAAILVRPVAGAKVAVLEKKHKWYKVKFNRFRDTIEGYVLHDALKLSGKIKHKGPITGIILPQQGGIVRQAPSTKAAKITALAKGAKVAILGKTANWFQIKYRAGADSATGYVYHTILQPNGDLSEIPLLPSKAGAVKEKRADTSGKTSQLNKSGAVVTLEAVRMKDSTITASDTAATSKSASFPQSSAEASDTLLQLAPKTTPSGIKSTSKLADKVKVDWVFIRGGSFKMGDTFGDGGADEGPVHEVYISDFYLAKYEVSVAQFRAFCDATGYPMPVQPKWNGDNHPVVNVTWQDAVAFCKWVGGRLPTEAEWEYAARARGKKKKYTMGNIFNGRRANHADQKANFVWSSTWDDGFKFTAPVGSYPKDDLGLYDMAGNVWEWCTDWYDAAYYQTHATWKNDPRGPWQGIERVLRGGSWREYGFSLRNTNRNHDLPSNRKAHYGFRPARSAQ